MSSGVQDRLRGPGRRRRAVVHAALRADPGGRGASSRGASQGGFPYTARPTAPPPRPRTRAKTRHEPGRTRRRSAQRHRHPSDARHAPGHGGGRGRRRRVRRRPDRAGARAPRRRAGRQGSRALRAQRHHGQPAGGQVPHRAGRRGAARGASRTSSSTSRAAWRANSGCLAHVVPGERGAFAPEQVVAAVRDPAARRPRGAPARWCASRTRTTARAARSCRSTRLRAVAGGRATRTAWPCTWTARGCGTPASRTGIAGARLGGHGRQRDDVLLQGARRPGGLHPRRLRRLRPPRAPGAQALGRRHAAGGHPGGGVPARARSPRRAAGRGPPPRARRLAAGFARGARACG